MKNVLIKLLSAICLSLMLSSCATYLLWEGRSNLSTGDTHEEIPYERDLGTDKIVALGQDKNSNRVLIFSTEYLIYLHNASSQEIQKLTAAKFSNSFYVDKEIKITTEDYLLVNANFPLYYKVANESEKQKIQQLGFHCKAEICHKNLDLLGDIYDLKASKVKIHRPSTQLARPLPFTFKQKTKKYGDKKVSAKVEEVVAATVLTPFALALDVITLPIQLFFAADFALSKPE
ncbi:hypothetical protein [Haemophilus sputorum]